MMKKIQNFFSMPSAPGILLCMAAILAMVMENSLFYGLYDALKDTPVVLQIGAFIIDKPLLLWINDGLMAVFFLLVGMEVKRELLEGQLSDRKHFILPAVAALGGILVPSGVYAAINWHNPGTFHGWAIPAATDIAFALGILMLLGKRVPAVLPITLMAIAIIDDLAAIIIIAVFYTSDTSLVSLGLAFVGLFFLYVFNRRGITSLGPYCVVGLFIWACVLKSGVHATLAGVVLGFFIPLRAKNKQGKSPLIAMEHGLHPWVNLGILPLFAFINAGVSLKGVSFQTFMEPITLGIVLGLFVGKQLGVMVFTGLAAFFRLCLLPKDVTWAQFYGLSLLTGVGFTMSLFIGTLAFDYIEYTEAVRLGVLSGSLLSAMAGVGVLLFTTKKRTV